MDPAIPRVLEIDRRKFPYKVCVYLNGVRRIGVEPVIANILVAYSQLFKLNLPLGFLGAYASLLVRNADKLEALMAHPGNGVIRGPDLVFSSQPIAEMDSYIYGAAVNVPGPKKVIFVNSDHERGRTYVTSYHELAHVAEYLTGIQVSHPALHTLSVVVASEVIPLLKRLRKALYG
jgi:hypothetical protein